jgi:hypothetical protein
VQEYLKLSAGLRTFAIDLTARLYQCSDQLPASLWTQLSASCMVGARTIIHMTTLAPGTSLRVRTVTHLSQAYRLALNVRLLCTKLCSVTDPMASNSQWRRAVEKLGAGTKRFRLA